MYIAMNRFRIAPGREADFINVWKNRNSQLESVPGFVEFHLLRLPIPPKFQNFRNPFDDAPDLQPVQDGKSLIQHEVLPELFLHRGL